MIKFLKEHILYIAWTIALVAMLGSLYFSNVLGFPPCVLCWYERIAMYPLVFIIGVGILIRDKNIPYFVLPLSGTGIIIATYHNLVYYSILPESIAPCTAGVSCITKFIEWFGFVTIPLLALSAFVLITISMIIYYKVTKQYVKRG